MEQKLVYCWHGGEAEKDNRSEKKSSQRRISSKAALRKDKKKKKNRDRVAVLRAAFLLRAQQVKFWSNTD